MFDVVEQCLRGGGGGHIAVLIKHLSQNFQKKSPFLTEVCIFLLQPRGNLFEGRAKDGLRYPHYFA